MTTVSVHEAKTHLSRLIEKVLAGEEVVIARNKEPVVQLTPVAAKRKRKPGRLKGVVHLDESFFEPLPKDELKAWGEI
jgi:prevent-host-death family protein